MPKCDVNHTFLLGIVRRYQDRLGVSGSRHRSVHSARSAFAVQAIAAHTLREWAKAKGE